MTEFHDLGAHRKLAQLEEKLKTSGGGPYDGGMDVRLAKLEQFAEAMRERLPNLESKLAHVDREVSQFKWWAAGSAVAIVLAMIATVLGTGLAIQQMTVTTFEAAKGAQTGAATPTQQPIIINVPPAPAPTPAR